MAVAYQKSIAICTGVSDYSESSQIATFFSREFGVIRGIFKGALRKKDAYASPLSPLSFYEVVFAARKKGLHILAETALLENFQPLAKDLSRYYSALAVLELIRVQKDESADPELFDLFLSSLRSIASVRHSYSVAFSFALQALSYLGFEPALESCAKCGSKLAAPQRKSSPRDVGKAPLSLAEGGLLCAKCVTAVRPDLWLSQPALSALRTLGKMPPERSGLVSLPDKLREEVAGFLQKFLEFTFEKEFKTVKYLTGKYKI